MKQNNQDDRRRYSRVGFSTRILLKTSGIEIEASGSTRDLSIKGVFIKTDQTIPLGTECNVTVLLSGGAEAIELCMKARVARVETKGLGLVFDSMDLDSYTHLKNILMYNTDRNDIIE